MTPLFGLGNAVVYVQLPRVREQLSSARKSVKASLSGRSTAGLPNFDSSHPELELRQNYGSSERPQAGLNASSDYTDSDHSHGPHPHDSSAVDLSKKVSLKRKSSDCLCGGSPHVSGSFGEKLAHGACTSVPSNGRT